MNIKPTPEQVREWVVDAFSKAPKDAPTEVYEQAVHVHLAELAAQWGAEQAQQTTVEEPELPEPIGYLSVHKVEGPFKYQFNKERAAVYPDNAISIEPVYTATQLAAARVQENERCAALVAKRFDECEPGVTPDMIRTLIGGSN